MIPKIIKKHFFPTDLGTKQPKIRSQDSRNYAAKILATLPSLRAFSVTGKMSHLQQRILANPLPPKQKKHINLANSLWVPKISWKDPFFVGCFLQSLHKTTRWLLKCSLVSPPAPSAPSNRGHEWCPAADFSKFSTRPSNDWLESEVHIGVVYFRHITVL